MAVALVVGSWHGGVEAAGTAEAGLTDREVSTLDILQRYEGVELYRDTDGRPVRAQAGNADLIRVTLDDVEPRAMSTIVQKDGGDYAQLIADANDTAGPSCFWWCQDSAEGWCTQRWGRHDCWYVFGACLCNPPDFAPENPNWPD